jgi:protein phosphatase methylesterase 1
MSVFERTASVPILSSSVEGFGASISVHIAGEAAHSTICLFLIHGAGSSALTWHLQVLQLKDHMTIVAPDLRGHGSSFIPTSIMINDLVDDMKCVLAGLPDVFSGKQLVLIGHSLGGPIAVRLASAIATISGVVVLDACEETALSSLKHVETMLSSWPSTFRSKEEYARWSTTISRPQSFSSAIISTSDHLVPMADDLFRPKFNLLDWKDAWAGWFAGFDELFLSLRMPHMLVLSHRDVLDVTLLSAIMQGKLECHHMSSPYRSHFFHEDSAPELLFLIIGFLKNRGFISEQIHKAICLNANRNIILSAQLMSASFQYEFKS